MSLSLNPENKLYVNKGLNINILSIINVRKIVCLSTIKPNLICILPDTVFNFYVLLLTGTFRLS